MRRIAALGGALLLTLALAGPAAANQVMYTEHDEWPAEWMLVNPANGADFECSGPLYYAGSGTYDLKLWYKNGETDPTPADAPWPWPGSSSSTTSGRAAPSMPRPRTSTPRSSR